MTACNLIGWTWRRRCSRSSERRCCRRRAFTDPAVLEWELANIFGDGWICAGHVSAVGRARRLRAPARSGARASSSIGGEDGTPRAFHNVCRHRGSRLVEEERGPGAEAAALSLPRLVLRPRGQPPRRSPHGRGRGLRPDLLRPASRCRSAVVGGLVLVDLSRRGRPGRGASRRAARRPRALQRRRAAARRAPDLRGRGQLEGDRRELQRVPALPRRPPGAERAQRLHERRERSTAPAPGAAAR